MESCTRRSICEVLQPKVVLWGCETQEHLGAIQQEVNVAREILYSTGSTTQILCEAAKLHDVPTYTISSN